MRLPRRVPWASTGELEELCSWIYTDEEDFESKTLAINRLSAWNAVTPLPHALDSTLTILAARMLDASCRDSSTSASLCLRQTYATAIIRMVNGLVDPLQSGAYARSIAAIAAQLGLPSWLVELRHAATHEDLPSLELLREASRESLSWLLHNYFHPTLNPSEPSSTSSLPLCPIAPLLKSYKLLMKTVVRDGSLRKQYQDKIDAVMRDIERWIAVAKVSVELAVNPLGWGLDDGSQVDIKEMWALENVCNALLERGAIVPTSKRKCCAPAGPFLPTTSSLALWTPLLVRLHATHATFPSVFIGRIVSVLLDDLTVSTPNADVIEVDSESLPEGEVYYEYLARWATWAVQTWAEESEYGIDMRKKVFLQLSPVFIPGHNRGSKTKILNDLLQAISADCKGLEDGVELLRSAATGVPINSWQTHDLADMEDRLRRALISSDYGDGIAEKRNATQSGQSLAAGWRLLDEHSNWAPCPIGPGHSHYKALTAMGVSHSRLRICTCVNCTAVPSARLNIRPSFPSFHPTLPKECQKATKIFSSFVDSRNNSLDRIIPRSILENAKGFAIFTVFKAGFLFSARAGSGVVIAKLPDGSWSAPSAIGSAGLGVGGQLGAEVTDFLIVLNSAAAVKSFMSAGSLTLGGNMSVAVGPLGRNGEAIGSLNTSGKVAAMYSYSKTKGLFGGVSIEGSVIVERQDANALAYNQDVTAKMLLSGAVPRPDWAEPLVKTLESCAGGPSVPRTQNWIDDRTEEQVPYMFGSANEANATGSKLQRFSFLGKKKKDTEFPPQHWGTRTNSGSYFSNDLGDPSPTRWDDIDEASRSLGFDDDYGPGSSTIRHPNHRPSRSTEASTTSRTFVDKYDPASPFNSLPPFREVHATLSDKAISHSRSMSTPKMDYATGQRDSPASYRNPFSSTPPPEEDFETHNETVRSSPPRFKTKPELSQPLSPLEGVARAIALYEFRAVEAGDLSFSRGDVIIITQKSETTDDWWRGKVNGKEGIFPANFVEIV